MAKKATDKPAEKAAAKPLSLEVLVVPPGETPPGVSGFFPPVATLSGIVVTDAAGADDAESDIPPKIVVGSERFGSTDEPPEALELPPVSAKASLEDHPAIELAQSFVTPHGKPDSEMGSYYTPPPPELRKPKAKA